MNSAHAEHARSTASPHPEGSTANSSPAPESTFNISNEETIRRLRAKGQPIRLFGESDKDRRLRLRALELIEEKDIEVIAVVPITVVPLATTKIPEAVKELEPITSVEPTATETTKEPKRIKEASTKKNFNAPIVIM